MRRHPDELEQLEAGIRPSGNDFCFGAAVEAAAMDNSPAASSHNPRCPHDGPRLDA
jgi:hypothetical protein